MYTFTFEAEKTAAYRPAPQQPERKLMRRTSKMSSNQYPLRRFASRCWIALACTFVLLIIAQPGLAQVDQGAVSGLITDSSGAVLWRAGDFDQYR